MASTDHVKISELELAKAADVVNGNAMLGRVIADMRNFSMYGRASSGSWSESDIGHNIVGGLRVIPNGSSIDVSPGVLVQTTGNLTPAPGTYDSNTLISFVRAVQTIAAPAPVADTYYLFEGQMQEEVTNETRDVLNEGTGNFVATSTPKVALRTVNMRFRAGTATDFPALATDWVPIAGVFRPAGGGAVLSTHITDMRMGEQDYEAEALRYDHNDPILNLINTDESEDISLSARAVPASSYAAKMSAVPSSLNAKFSPANCRAAAFSAYTANTWYYLWLAPWQSSIAPRHHVKDATASAFTMTARGVLALSASGPSERGSSGATVALPRPFSVATTTSGRCLVALRRNAGNTGWVASAGCGRFVQFYGAQDSYDAYSAIDYTYPGVNVAFTGSLPSALTIPISAVPVNAKRIRVAVHVHLHGVTGAGAGSWLDLFVEPVGSNVEIHRAALPMPSASGDQRATFEFELPYSSTGWDVKVNGLTTGSITTHVRLTGYYL